MTVHRVVVQLQAPTAADPLGTVTEGFYTLDGKKLQMTYADGRPVEGFPVETISPGCDPAAVARVLTKKVRRQVLGLSETAEAFARKLDYLPAGQA